jgi:hypothetical protein
VMLTVLLLVGMFALRIMQLDTPAEVFLEMARTCR